MSFTLLDFQREAVEFGKKHEYCIYALQMGLGKTACSIVTAVETNSKALIICPAYLALNWQKEIKKFFPEKRVELHRHKDDFYYAFDADFVIATYSFLDHAEILFEWADMVIYDEAQYLKNMNAKRTEAAHRFTYENSTKRCLLLTGTPILNRVHELHSLLSIVEYNPKITESIFLKKFPTYIEFANTFSNLIEYEIMRGNKRVPIKKWEGVKNLDALKRLLSTRMIRKTSAEVLDLMPSKDIFIQVDDKNYPELEKDFRASISEIGDKTNSKAKREAAFAKAPLTVQYAKDMIENGYQVIIYSDHVDAAEYIAEKLGQKAVTGTTDMDWRMRKAEEFQKGDLDCIVATIGAFSTGVNLHNAFNMIFNDPPWVPGTMDQAKFRIIRVGQKNECTFHYMIGSPQDEYIYKVLSEKIEVIEKTLG